MTTSNAQLPESAQQGNKGTRGQSGSITVLARMCVLAIALIAAGCSGSGTAPDPEPTRTLPESTSVIGTCEIGLSKPREYHPQYNPGRDDLAFRIDEGRQFRYTRYFPNDESLLHNTEEKAAAATERSKEREARRRCWVADWSFTCPHNTREWLKEARLVLPADEAVDAPDVRSHEEGHGRIYPSWRGLIEEHCGAYVNGWLVGSTDLTFVYPFGHQEYTLWIASGEVGLGLNNPHQAMFCTHNEQREVEWQVNDGEAHRQAWLTRVERTAIGTINCGLQAPGAQEFLEALKLEGVLSMRLLDETGKTSRFLSFNINGYDMFVAPIV